MRYFTPASSASRLWRLVGDEDVEGDRDQLQRDEEEHEVVGRGEQHQADGGEERQDDEFAAVLDRGLHLVAHPDDERADGEEEEVEELGRAVPDAQLPQKSTGELLSEQRLDARRRPARPARASRSGAA